jgi:hypothetical protein
MFNSGFSEIAKVVAGEVFIVPGKRVTIYARQVRRPSLVMLQDLFSKRSRQAMSDCCSVSTISTLAFKKRVSVVLNRLKNLRSQ